MANETEIQSVVTLSSKSEATLFQHRRTMNPPLHERCTMVDMLKLRDVFKEAYMGKLQPSELRGHIREILNVEYDEEEYNILFLKVSNYISNLILTQSRIL